ncbi:MAG: TetR/AcrR family transcriptional regulator [Caulobacteraceae bacterium]|nr:TetR/AcrR family transcriptional regulator [Caulobacteraceae bacterium]
MFAEYGPEAVTIRQLASELGVSPMTPYRYFKDKDAILAAVRARAFDRHAEALETAYRDHPGDPGARSDAIGAAYVDFALGHPEAYKLMFDIKQPTAWDYPELNRAGERSRATMTAHVRDLVGAGWLRGDPEWIGHLYWGALHGPLMLRFSGLIESDEMARRLIDGLVAAVTRSVMTQT